MHPETLIITVHYYVRGAAAVRNIEMTALFTEFMQLGVLNVYVHTFEIYSQIDTVNSPEGTPKQLSVADT